MKDLQHRKLVIQRIVILMWIMIVALMLGAVILWRTKGPALLAMMFLPHPSPEGLFSQASPMPPVEDLLAQYEAFLSSKVPAVLAALQPGLTEAEIDALEKQHKFKLPADLRALYRWRNGTPRNVNLAAFPNHWFVPLDVALVERDEIHRQIKTLSTDQQQELADIGYRLAWLGLIVDGAGDGYFFDPGGSESQGSFFYFFAEDRGCVIYPAFRNYLEQVLEGQKSGIFVATPQGVGTADFEKAVQLGDRFGATPPR
jgi:cell wall assembly regulator SMI1